MRCAVLSSSAEATHTSTSLRSLASTSFRRCGLSRAGFVGAGSAAGIFWPPRVFGMAAANGRSGGGLA